MPRGQGYLIFRDILPPADNIIPGGYRTGDSYGMFVQFLSIFDDDYGVRTCRQHSAGGNAPALSRLNLTPGRLAHGDLTADIHISGHALTGAEGIPGPHCKAIHCGAIKTGHILQGNYIHGKPAAQAFQQRNPGPRIF
ncbi:MAG: hypothetical protein BWY80_01439 [Firmicutes bacterium ADurb.Bin456]|nr:MAG: hypothetical protein BWY80_01439 [Firmicutes bacterium ADurb.Bin456]